MPAMPKAPLDPERDLWFLGTLMRVHHRGRETDGRFTVVEQVAPVGFSPPRHVHEVEDTLMVVLEGRLTVVVGDQRRTVSRGESVFLPRGVPHTFRVDEAVRLLEIGTPGGFEEFYADNAEPAAALELPPAAVPDIERLGRTAAQHRTPLLGPPLGAED
jgi:quercetin dioxygenase-like cupin family protein